MKGMRALVTALAVAMAVTPAVAVAQEAEVLQLINKERAKKGCAPLTMNSQLSAAAKGHATAMAKQNFFSHKGKNGSTLRSRATKAGYKGRKLGENIAAGWPTPAKAVSQWMNSSGHRKNILTCSFKETGIAMVYDPNDAPLPGNSHAMKYYWVQVFGTR